MPATPKPDFTPKRVWLFKYFGFKLRIARYTLKQIKNKLWKMPEEPGAIVSVRLGTLCIYFGRA